MIIVLNFLINLYFVFHFLVLFQFQFSFPCFKMFCFNSVFVSSVVLINIVWRKYPIFRKTSPCITVQTQTF